MPRPIWSGAISFGLVSIPVKLYNAVNRKSVSFNQLDSRDNQRIRYRKVNADTGDEVPDDLIVKGYEVTKGRYIIVDPDELEQFMPTVTRSIDLDEFVDLTEIDPLFYDSPYYLAPDKVTKPYALLARAMEEAGKVGVGRFVMRNKEYVAAVRPVDGRLVLSTMVHADEVVDPTEHRGARRARRRRDLRQGAQDGRAARGLAGRAVRAGALPRQLPAAGARPAGEAGRRRGDRGARAAGHRPAGRRPHGGPGGQREGGQGGPGPPPHGGRAPSR